MSGKRTRRSHHEPAETRQLTVLGRYGYGSIPTITQFVAEAARSAMLDEDSVFHCQMAVDEACTNVIEHAYGDAHIENFEIECLVQPGKCVIRIVDHGQPFDPTTIPVPKATVSISDLRPGGIGLHLMRQLMDEVRFEFSDQGNTLIMVKTSSQPTSEPSSMGIPVRHDSRDIWVIEPHGQVDSLMSGKLDETIEEMLKKGHIWVVADMTLVSYISSRGLKALVSGWRKAQDNGGYFVLCCVVPRVYSIIETIGFNQIFDIFATLDEALDAVVDKRKFSASR